jgi:hypothetical protein
VNTTTTTQYGIAYLGRHDPVLTFSSREEADDYIRRGVAAGNSAADYLIARRVVTVTHGDWKPVLVETRVGTPDTHALLDGDRDVVDVPLPDDGDAL